MTTISLEDKKSTLKVFFIKNTLQKRKGLQDFKKYIVKSGKKEKENIGEFIDNFLYN